jgi:hypothetical protein
MTRLLPGGSILAIVDGPNSLNQYTRQQTIRDIDLAGNVLQETNATRVREQLSGLGLASRCSTPSVVGQQCAATSFHHEVTRLANGHTLCLAHIEKIFPPGTQGSSSPNPVDVIGDLVIDLDQNLQVVWYWNAFDHLDVDRAAVLGETCTPVSPGCQPHLMPLANDWLHSNSIYYRPQDGNLLVSMRHQDWVIKIDYDRGVGTGAVLWRLGLDGDFTITDGTSDPYPWFSHQPDAGHEASGTTVLSLFDNGNTRRLQYRARTAADRFSPSTKTA